MEHIEEFTIDGKSFIYIDLAGFMNNTINIGNVEQIKPILEKYSENSIYLIVNAALVRLDSNSKSSTMRYIEKIKPLIKCAAILGTDGVKKLMIKAAVKTGGHQKIYFAFSREKAIEWLLKQE